MRAGHESGTAVGVCSARAVAHGRTPITRFSDPTALALLPEDERERVERFRAGIAPSSLRESMDRRLVDQRIKMVVSRTVAIDDAVRAAHTPQLVILGAGLDGRAWRMPELADVTVFEIDHPDSQRAKRTRAAALQPTARDVRFVPVDFARDSLADALSTAGHDPAHPTTWVWEGVIMYLARPDVEATLRVIEGRSAPGSRLVLLYLSPSLLLRMVSALGRFVSGEAIRSIFTVDDMRALLARFGFDVIEDRDIVTIAQSLGDDVSGAGWALRYLRILTACRAASSD